MKKLNIYLESLGNFKKQMPSDIFPGKIYLKSYRHLKFTKSTCSAHQIVACPILSCVLLSQFQAQQYGSAQFVSRLNNVDLIDIFAMQITTPTNIADHFYLGGWRDNADLTNIADLTNNADQVGMWIAWKYGSKHNADQLGIRNSFHIAYQLGMWISTQCGPAWLCLFFCLEADFWYNPPAPAPPPAPHQKSQKSKFAYFF